MIVGVKDAVKLIGISVVACCAVLVCTMFFNFYLDVLLIEDKILTEEAMRFYNAQVSTAKVVCLVSGGCLLITSVIMLFFYIKHYIDTHKKELGILKALGYSNRKIAGSFWVFGVGVFLGTAVGFAAAFLLMPAFYRLQNEGSILPAVTIGFHLSVPLYFVLLPTAAFAALSVCYAGIKLKKPALALLKGETRGFSKIRKYTNGKDVPFLTELRKNTLKSKKTLVFFIVFAAFCYSAMTQMSFSMKDLSSVMMGAMILLIGLVLACVTLFLALKTVMDGNAKTIAMMRVLGYSQKECGKAVLGGYRPLSYIGFAVGTAYQYALLRVMVDIVFKDIEGVPVYQFDFPMLFVSLVSFIAIYELVMYYYSKKMEKVSVKEIMTE